MGLIIFIESLCRSFFPLLTFIKTFFFQLLKSILCSLTEVYITDWMSLPQGFNLPPTEHFYIRDWGKPCPLEDLNPNWHTPGQDELNFVNELLTEFLLPGLELLKEFIAGKSLTRYVSRITFFLLLSQPDILLRNKSGRIKLGSKKLLIWCYVKIVKGFLYKKFHKSTYIKIALFTILLFTPNEI